MRTLAEWSGLRMGRTIIAALGEHAGRCSEGRSSAPMTLFMSRRPPLATLGPMLISGVFLTGCEKWWAHNLTFGAPSLEDKAPDVRSWTSAAIAGVIDEVAVRHGFIHAGRCGDGYKYFGSVRDCALLGCSDRKIEMWAVPLSSGAVAVRLFEFLSPTTASPAPVKTFEAELAQTIEARFGAGSILARSSDDELGPAGLCGPDARSSEQRTVEP